MLKILLILFSLVVLNACQANNINNMAASDIPKTQDESELANQELETEMLKQWQQGQIVFNEFEGGFYGIVTSSGEKLLPLNLTKAFHHAGSQIRFKGELKNVMTIYQWGKPFQLTDIELITLSSEQTKTKVLNAL